MKLKRKFLIQETKQQQNRTKNEIIQKYNEELRK